MRDDYDADAWTGWSQQSPAPYPCAFCAVVVSGPADPTHDFTKHPKH